MPTLTNSATFVFGPAAPAVVDTTIEVLALPAPSAPTGNGRLVHPTFGALDYTYAPNTWSGLDGDIIIDPVWASAKTLKGSANTLWRGEVRDVVCVETWDSDSGDLRMPVEMLRSLLSFYMNPPDPADGHVEWRPTYTSSQVFKVALVSLTVGGQGVTLDSIATRKNWVRRDVQLTLKVLGRV